MGGVHEEWASDSARGRIRTSESDSTDRLSRMRDENDRERGRVVTDCVGSPGALIAIGRKLPVQHLQILSESLLSFPIFLNCPVPLLLQLHIAAVQFDLARKIASRFNQAG